MRLTTTVTVATVAFIVSGAAIGLKVGGWPGALFGAVVTPVLWIGVPYVAIRVLDRLLGFSLVRANREGET